MAGRNRWTRNPDDPNDSGQVDPEPDDCCCSWLKPKSKPIDQSKKRNEKAEDTNREGKEKVYNNGGNKNARFVPDSSPGVSRDQQGTTKTNKYTENDPIDTAKNVALKENPMWTHDQENSHGIPRNMKPSSQQEDYRRQEIKKNGKYTAPNTANVTKSKDQGYSSEEENNASYGGTRPEKKISSTVEQASTLKEIKNRQEDILEDQHKGDHKAEYNRGIHRDTGPDLTKKESSSPEQAAAVQKREGKQKETKGINNNDEQFKGC